MRLACFLGLVKIIGNAKLRLFVAKNLCLNLIAGYTGHNRRGVTSVLSNFDIADEQLFLRSKADSILKVDRPSQETISMPFLIIVIGKPGSGKSTFTQLLSSKFQSRPDYRIQVLNDRDILLEMAHGNDLRELIRPLDAKNFEIVDDAAYDIAVDRLLTKLGEVEDDQISLVEFSRKEYVRTFQRFGDLFSGSGSLAIYLDTPFDVCKERNIERAISNQSYSVPSDEMESYFKVDDIEQLILANPAQVIVLNNELEVAELARQLEEIWPMLQQTVSQRRD